MLCTAAYLVGTIVLPMQLVVLLIAVLILLIDNFYLPLLQEMLRG